MRSMTGFGRSTVTAGDRRYAVEIRSVNGRGLDVKIRSSDPDAGCEAEIMRAVRAALDRGSVTVGIREEGGEPPVFDAARAKAVYAELERLRQALGMSTPVDLATVAAFLGGGTVPAPVLRGEGLWQALAPAVTEALASLRAMREGEGAALRADIEPRLRALRTLAARIEDASRALPERFARRLAERLSSLTAGVGLDPGRLAQEAAVLAERLDVSEELARLRVHLDHLEALLADGGPVGRKIDFVVQEIGREINTTGSKAQDAGIAGLVIEAKAELEKIREQAQNIE